MSKKGVNVSLDPKLKEEASLLFANFGLDLSTAITLFLQQSVREQRIPFEISMNVPNRDTVKALNERSKMKKDKEKYKRYESFDEALKDLDK